MFFLLQFPSFTITKIFCIGMKMYFWYIYFIILLFFKAFLTSALQKTPIHSCRFHCVAIIYNDLMIFQIYNLNKNLFHNMILKTYLSFLYLFFRYFLFDEENCLQKQSELEVKKTSHMCSLAPLWNCKDL